MKCTLTVHLLHGRPAFGADGLVRALCAATSEHPLSLDEARLWGGVACRTYQLTPDDNWAYRASVSRREWAWSSLAMDSYGVKESLSAHMHRDLREWPIDKPATLIALVRVELEQGRGALVNLDGLRPFGDESESTAPRFALGCGEWGYISALSTPKGTQSVPLPEGFDAGVVLSFDALGKDAKGLPSTVLTLRPPYENPPESRLRALRRDVLNFAGAHAKSKRELNFHDEFYYASGHRAWSITAELLGSRWAPLLDETKQPDTAGPSGSADAVAQESAAGAERSTPGAPMGATEAESQATAEYLRIWLADVAAARRSAARSLPNAQVAARFDGVAAAAEEALAAAEELSEVGQRAALAAALERAAAADISATKALKAWLEDAPEESI